MSNMNLYDFIKSKLINFISYVEKTLPEERRGNLVRMLTQLLNQPEELKRYAIGLSTRACDAKGELIVEVVKQHLDQLTGGDSTPILEMACKYLKLIVNVTKKYLM
jgi:hypothetical protein